MGEFALEFKGRRPEDSNGVPPTFILPWHGRKSCMNLGRHPGAGFYCPTARKGLWYSPEVQCAPFDISADSFASDCPRLGGFRATRDGSRSRRRFLPQGG